MRSRSPSSVRSTLTGLKKNFPPGLEYAIALDTTEFVHESISEVVKTLRDAIILVILVVFLFLQSFRADARADPRRAGLDHRAPSSAWPRSGSRSTC